MNQYVSRTLQECQTRLPVSDLRFSNDSESQCAMGFVLFRQGSSVSLVKQAQPNTPVANSVGKCGRGEEERYMPRTA